MVDRSRFTGVDQDGNPIFDNSAKIPTLRFHGTVKLHGTNAAVCFNRVDGLWVQSRENIISVYNDNAGFASYVESNKDAFQKMIDDYALDNMISLTDKSLCIYGEWCGKGIQNGTAINHLDKMFVVFGVKLMSSDDEEPIGNWIDHSALKDHSIRCFNIEEFPTFDIDIDFSKAALFQNQLIEMTLKVEDECPVGKFFGISGIGEGIVFSSVQDDGSVLRFKSKGEKHAGRTKVRTIKQVDDAKEQLKLNIASQITPVWRIDQGIQEVFNTLNGGTMDISRLGEVIKWVNQDIMKEESHTISEAGLEPREVMSKVSPLIKERFFERMNEELKLI